MPPRYLRHSRQYCLQYYSKILGYIASGNKKHRGPLPPARLRSRTRVNFAGMPAVKTDMASRALLPATSDLISEWCRGQYRQLYSR